MRVVRVAPSEPLTAAVERLGIPAGRPVLILVGGANDVGPAELDAVDKFVQTVVVPVIRSLGTAVVDGGTDSGIMRSLGRAAAATGVDTPLVGVAVAALVEEGSGTGLEPHHSHVLLVDGREWGDESEALSDVAAQLAAGAPTATVLLNGGEVSRRDVSHSLRRGRPVVVVKNTGRLADELAADPGAGVVVLDAHGSATEARRALTELLSAGQ